jgi:DNA-binding NarL/FixJ family response regulator
LEIEKVLKIAIVDDHTVYRKSLAKTVKRIFPGSQISEFNNGLEFVTMLPCLGYLDLVFMDIKMPEMDGIEATGIAMQLDPDLRILAISMYDHDEMINEMIQAGAFGFLQKGGDKTCIHSACTALLKGEKYYKKRQGHG